MFKPEEIEFIECDTCKAKPGSPQLCPGCYNNRTAIYALKAMLTAVENEKNRIHEGARRFAQRRYEARGRNIKD